MGNIFNDLVRTIEANQANHARGYFNCIPFSGMNRLESFIPGIEQSTYYLLTANSGVGKSKLGRSLFIHNPYEYLKNNPQDDIKLDIYYFSLEESREKVILSEISKYLFSKYRKRVSIKQLLSRGRYNTIDPETIKQIHEARDYINEFLEVVKIIDNVRSPSAIFNYMQNVAYNIGTFFDSQGVELSRQEHERIKADLPGAKDKISYYRTTHPRHYVIVLTDHISLLYNEKSPTGSMMSQWETMSTFSNKYCISLRDKYGFIPVNVQQQTSAKEQVESNFRGASVTEKLEPSLDGLANNKETQRDANIVLGLFSPARYKITEHRTYDITFWDNFYRSMHILKINFRIKEKLETGTMKILRGFVQKCTLKNQVNCWEIWKQTISS